ncbi:hypothetical protein FDP41_005438 [Naegleria fowleri]|uniref:AB hydrolase-1 domain-containing protein n=1 Tax=Naegleria fowleri TaxID=5763 RepID=A0A6A5BN06_NAEFO|nr:uncharacterized protein FDP41_005438 [Naegleria fowleri]KAF0975444.1 hypothetical protein FDP41_005438 [Naegleria fowleri]CAG4715529.1 unnamed protein product [Naegleria fowleri]
MLAYLGFIAIFLFIYYRQFVCERVKLYYTATDNPTVSELVDRTFSNSERATFCPTPYLINTHLQTIFNVALRPDINWYSYDTEEFTFKCGGHILLDWVHDNRLPRTDESSEDEMSGDDLITEESPIMLVFAGVCGGSKEIEIKHFVSYVVRDGGMRAVVVNYRGAQTQLKTPVFGLTSEDIDVVINHIKNKFPKAIAIIACGFSLGSNIMTKYLGEVGKDSPIDFAISVSNPFNLETSSRRLQDELVNRLIYDKVFTKKRKELVLAHEHVFEITPVKMEKVKRVSSTLEFDDVVSREILGMDSLSNLYQRFSCKHDITGIQIPVLFLNALDDPISSKHAIPYDDLKENTNIILATTERGGHVAWLDGLTPYKAVPSWMERTCVHFARACVAIKQQQKSRDVAQCETK